MEIVKITLLVMPIEYFVILIALILLINYLIEKSVDGGRFKKVLSTFFISFFFSILYVYLVFFFRFGEYREVKKDLAKNYVSLKKEMNVVLNSSFILTKSELKELLQLQSKRKNDINELYKFTRIKSLKKDIKEIKLSNIEKHYKGKDSVIKSQYGKVSKRINDIESDLIRMYELYDKIYNSDYPFMSCFYMNNSKGCGIDYNLQPKVFNILFHHYKFTNSLKAKTILSNMNNSYLKLNEKNLSLLGRMFVLNYVRDIIKISLLYSDFNPIIRPAGVTISDSIKMDREINFVNDIEPLLFSGDILKSIFVRPRLKERVLSIILSSFNSTGIVNALVDPNKEVQNIMIYTDAYYKEYLEFERDGKFGEHVLIGKYLNEEQKLRLKNPLGYHVKKDSAVGLLSSYLHSTGVPNFSKYIEKSKRIELVIKEFNLAYSNAN